MDTPRKDEAASKWPREGEASISDTQMWLHESARNPLVVRYLRVRRLFRFHAAYVVALLGFVAVLSLYQALSAGRNALFDKQVEQGRLLARALAAESSDLLRLPQGNAPLPPDLNRPSGRIIRAWILDKSGRTARIAGDGEDAPGHARFLRQAAADPYPTAEWLEDWKFLISHPVYYDEPSSLIPEEEAKMDSAPRRVGTVALLYDARPSALKPYLSMPEAPYVIALIFLSGLYLWVLYSMLHPRKL